MKNDLNNVLGQLTGLLGSLDGMVKNYSEKVEEQKKELSPEARKVVTFFEKKMMEEANKGNFNEISRLTKKMNERLNQIQNANTNK
jgi:hypothetical protein